MISECFTGCKAIIVAFLFLLISLVPYMLWALLFSANP